MQVEDMGEEVSVMGRPRRVLLHYKMTLIWKKKHFKESKLWCYAIVNIENSVFYWL